MNSKDYLVEALSKEEKVYLKKIVMTAKNKYIKRNKQYINSTDIVLNDAIIVKEDSILEIILQECAENIQSAMEFEKLLTEPKLYNIVKSLSLQEKEVLFYLYKKQKKICEIGEIMGKNRRTIRRIRDKAQKKIAENLIKGDF